MKREICIMLLLCVVVPVFQIIISANASEEESSKSQFAHDGVSDLAKNNYEKFRSHRDSIINRSTFLKSTIHLLSMPSHDHIPHRTSPDLYHEGVVLADTGQYEAAVKAYDEAIRLNNTNVDAWIGKGNALLMQGKYNESVKLYDQVVRLNPNYAMVAGVLRNAGDGWYAIDDSEHTPLNIDSVSQNKDNIIINYTSIHSKYVHSLLCTPDETFAGTYTFGASVGLESADIFLYRGSKRISPQELVSSVGNIWILGIFQT